MWSPSELVNFSLAASAFSRCSAAGVYSTESTDNRATILSTSSLHPCSWRGGGGGGGRRDDQYSESLSVMVGLPEM